MRAAVVFGGSCYMNMINKNKQIISLGDIVDSYFLLRSKGLWDVIKRIRFSSRARTGSHWGATLGSSSSWWEVPAVRNRWNKIISGSVTVTYPEYVCNRYFPGRSDLMLLSPGCGTGTKEIAFAKTGLLQMITGFDLSKKRIHCARSSGKEYSSLHFQVGDIYQTEPEESYDIILFDSSLHHFTNFDNLFNKMIRFLKPKGIIIINEYVGPNRFQWSNAQLVAANLMLNSIPVNYRIRYGCAIYKSRIYRPGLLRMVLSDPSEAAESERILSVLHNKFDVLEEKWLGGNLLVPVLKDIAHNFLNDDPSTTEILARLFREEDEFVRAQAHSDYVFGVYRPRVGSPTFT